MRVKAYLRLPAPFPSPDSLTIADASHWYRIMIPFIPDAIEGKPDDFERFVGAWGIKCQLRLAAALSMIDPRLIPRFLATFCLPSVEDYIDMARANFGGDFGYDDILSLLLTLSEQEQFAFPGTVGGITDPIGFKYSDGLGIYTFTSQGWEQKPISN